MSTGEEITQQKAHTASDIYWRCPFCKEEMFEKGLQFPSLKQLKKEHAKVCERYERWTTANKNEEEEVQKLRLDGKQMMEAQLKFALQKIYDKKRLQKKLDDPSISPEEKEFKIRRELRQAEGRQEHHIAEARKLLNDENEHISGGAKEEWGRCQKMKGMKERYNAYRLF